MRLRNRGFMKYVIMKLFSKITHAQRNELLKTDTPFSNICELITFQEAERRLIWDGETVFALSQGKDADEASSVPLGPNLNNNTSFSSNATNNGCMAETSLHQRIFSPEGWILFFSPPQLFTLKIPAKYNC